MRTRAQTLKSLILMDYVSRVNSLSTCENLADPLRSGGRARRAPPWAEPAPATAYLIWKNPYMVAAGGTFIHDMLGRMGLQNLFSQKKRYPETTLEELAALQPQVILLSSEPFPFQEKHTEEFRRHCPAAVIKLVDGEMFSWYGSRLLLAAPYFAKLRLEIGHTLEKIC